MNKFGGSSDNSGTGEVFFEFTTVGNYVRVVAIDATTGIEITMVGNKTVGRTHLERLALRKLQKRIKELAK